MVRDANLSQFEDLANGLRDEVCRCKLSSSNQEMGLLFDNISLQLTQIEKEDSDVGSLSEKSCEVLLQICRVMGNLCFENQDARNYIIKRDENLNKVCIRTIKCIFRLIKDCQSSVNDKAKSVVNLFEIACKFFQNFCLDSIDSIVFMTSQQSTKDDCGEPTCLEILFSTFQFSYSHIDVKDVAIHSMYDLLVCILQLLFETSERAKSLQITDKLCQDSSKFPSVFCQIFVWSMNSDENDICSDFCELMENDIFNSSEDITYALVSRSNLISHILAYLNDSNDNNLDIFNNLMNCLVLLSGHEKCNEMLRNTPTLFKFIQSTIDVQSVNMNFKRVSTACLSYHNLLMSKGATEHCLKSRPEIPDNILTLCRRIFEELSIVDDSNQNSTLEALAASLACIRNLCVYEPQRVKFLTTDLPSTMFEIILHFSKINVKLSNSAHLHTLVQLKPVESFILMLYSVSDATQLLSNSMLNQLLKCLVQKMDEDTALISATQVQWRMEASRLICSIVRKHPNGIQNFVEINQKVLIDKILLSNLLNSVNKEGLPSKNFVLVNEAILTSCVIIPLVKDSSLLNSLLCGVDRVLGVMRSELVRKEMLQNFVQLLSVFESVMSTVDLDKHVFEKCSIKINHLFSSLEEIKSIYR